MYHLWRRGSETVCWGQICNLGENACGYIPQFGRGIFRPNEGWSLKSFQLSSNGFHISTFPKCYKYISHVWRKTLFCREIIFVNLNYLTCTVFKRDLWVVSFLCVVFKVKVISRHPFSSGGLPGVKFGVRSTTSPSNEPFTVTVGDLSSTNLTIRNNMCKSKIGSSFDSLHFLGVKIEKHMGVAKNLVTLPPKKSWISEIHGCIFNNS